MARTKRPDKVEVYKDSALQWRWRRIAPNGEIISDSGEGYVLKFSARRAAQRVNPDVEITVV